MLLVVALVVVVAETGCIHTTKVKIYECPDITDAAIDDLRGEALVWYTFELDPWCESLANAADAGQ